MKRIGMGLLALALVVTGLFASGCISKDEATRNLNNSANLRVGMTKEEVLSIMGPPLEKELFNRPDRWYYYVNPRWYDNLSTEDECMPLLFEHGKLIGWGNEFYARYRLDRSFGKTPKTPEKAPKR